MQDRSKIKYHIRKVKPKDLEQVTAIEAACFNSAEAASGDTLKKRIDAFPDSFFVAEEEDGRIIGFINGCVTDEKTICDEMFENQELNNPHGAYQSVFGLDVLPMYRSRGIAAALMRYLIEESEKNGRKGLILTCKEALIPYYEQFGYINRGLSASVHGNAVWYDMILEFSDKG